MKRVMKLSKLSDIDIDTLCLKRNGFRDAKFKEECI